MSRTYVDWSGREQEHGDWDDMTASDASALPASAEELRRLRDVLLTVEAMPGRVGHATCLDMVEVVSVLRRALAESESPPARFARPIGDEDLTQPHSHYYESESPPASQEEIRLPNGWPGPSKFNACQKDPDCMLPRGHQGQHRSIAEEGQ